MCGLEMPVVVAVCGDPGGANAVAPVIEALQTERRVIVHGLAYRQARALWTKRNLAFSDLNEDITRLMVVEWLRQSGAALVLTGTSFNTVELEKQFIAAARELKVPSLAVLDFWSNYARRFSNAEGGLVYVPDRIAIMDERARAEMMAEGFHPERLVVTGQPVFDDLAVWRSRFTPARGQAIRDGLNIQPDELLILFLSEPLSQLCGTDPANPLYPGYDEQTVLRALVPALDQIAEENRQKLVLVVRPHPRESAEAFYGHTGGATRIVVSSEGEARNLVMTADLVIGIDTMLLVEACYLGCVTVSLQPNLRLPDTLPTNAWGVSRAIYHEAEIRPVIEKLLLHKEARREVKGRMACLRLDVGATQRVVKLVYQMIGLEQR
jgi:hypothetical protein